MIQPFDVRSAEMNGALVIEVSGDVDGAVETQFVEHVVGGVSITQAERVVLDLSRVGFMDSSGLRMVLSCKRRADEREIPLTLAIASDSPVSRLFDVSGVAATFQYEQLD